MSYVNEMETLAAKRPEIAKVPPAKALSGGGATTGEVPAKSAPALTKKQQRAKLWAERKAAANQTGG